MVFAIWFVLRVIYGVGICLEVCGSAVLFVLSLCVALLCSGCVMIFVYL